MQYCRDSVTPIHISCYKVAKTTLNVPNTQFGQKLTFSKAPIPNKIKLRPNSSQLIIKSENIAKTTQSISLLLQALSVSFI